MESKSEFHLFHRKLTEDLLERISKNRNPIASTDHWSVVFQENQLLFLRLPIGEPEIRAQLKPSGEKAVSIDGLIIPASMSLVEATQIVDMVLFGTTPNLDVGRKIESVEKRVVSNWQNGFLDPPYVQSNELTDKTTSLYWELAQRYSVSWTKVPVLPFIENTYFNKNVLRVMHVGMNAYTRDLDFVKMQNSEFAKTSSEWWRSWASEDKWPIHQWMSHNHNAFSAYCPSQYRCNAVKIWMPESRGKQERLVANEVFEEAKRSMKGEFDLLSDIGVRPDVVVCYGGQAWRSVWPYFFEKHGGPNSPIVELQRHVAFKINFHPKPMLVCRVLHHGGRRFKNRQATVDAHKVVKNFAAEFEWAWAKR